MVKTRTLYLAGMLLVPAFTWSAAASAQATRTWVSGVGDDVNPCSRTAPCKTFAGAISKTAAGGEINCLDPGGFGAVTITKSLTIDCKSTEAGVLAAGNGITVNAGAADVVVLRGLDIFGVNPPSNGVRFIAGGALHIEDSVIRRFNAVNSFGVAFQPSGAARLYIVNTTITNNGDGGGTGGGVLIQPTGTGSAQAELSNVRVLNNAGVGIKIDTTGNTSATGVVLTARWSQFSGSPVGLSVIMPSGNAPASAMVADSMIDHNLYFGLAATGSGTAVVRVGQSIISGNGTAVFSSGGGTVRSYGTNQVDGNTNPSSFAGTTLPQS